MPTGRLKWYDPRLGYGFIIPDEGGPDVFVHGRALDRAELWLLEPGHRLHYTLRDRKPVSKGQSAEYLRDASVDAIVEATPRPVAVVTLRPRPVAAKKSEAPRDVWGWNIPTWGGFRHLPSIEFHKGSYDATI